MTPADASQLLRDQGRGWWRGWDHGAITAACAAVPLADLADWPELAHWRALAAFMGERGEALDLLDLAWAGHEARRDAAGSALACAVALVFCVVDVGAMDRVSVWQARADARAPASPAGDPNELWLRLGTLARVALGRPDSPAAALEAAWLNAQLRSLRTPLAADERLLAALVLIQHRFITQRFEQFDQLASQVESPTLFDAASALLRARWAFMLGYGHYHVGNHGAAEAAWQRALDTAAASGSANTRVQAALALARLQLGSDRVDEAERTLDAIRPQWGVGRTAQLIQLHQIRARLLMARGQPTRALALLHDAQQLADEAALPTAECAFFLADRAQVDFALGRADAAAALLATLAGACSGRDGQVAACLLGLLRAWQTHATQPTASRAVLAEALGIAKQTRYTGFFNLLPALAASLCALALRWGVEPHFIGEAIRARKLPAPADADAQWPWPLWLGMLGGFERRQQGEVQAGGGKTQHKPLELLRLLACERGMALPAGTAARALWPDADTDDLAQRNLEVAVHRLRKLLGDATLLRVHDGRIALDAGRASSDVLQRRALVERIESLAMRPGAAASKESEECLVLVERVIALTRGELLPGAPDANWLAAERQRCRQETVRAALAAASVLERAHASRAERQLLEAALRIEPLAEALVRRLMQAYQRAEQRSDALRVFETHRGHLDALGTRPGPQVTALWRELLDAK